MKSSRGEPAPTPYSSLWWEPLYTAIIGEKLAGEPAPTPYSAFGVSHFTRRF
ncbi:hypothetical protein PFLA_b1192 [Pseudoalteromonas flavipulchra NCIMB 2033 = ATCC BAA-314]|nr:hypothetical protein [Pseudoalteromonas flavipulchra NCIMB 2033 = ATCC BAA-314]